MRGGVPQHELFTKDELNNIQPTGSPWVVSKDDPATVPVPIQTTIVKIQGDYTERDRKLWVFLLHAVFEELGTKPMHALSVREINNVFRELGGEHDNRWLWESVRRLASTIAEWRTVTGTGDERFEELGIGALLGASLSKKARELGELKFWFPPNLIPIIKEPMRFARLRVHFLLSLSGKYAVTLYEILEGFANRRDGACEVSIDDLRMWLKVPDNSYSEWRDFHKRVLAPAVKQINDDPVGAGFYIEYSPIRIGRTFQKISFKLTKTDNRQATEKLLKTKSATKRRAKQGARPPLRPDAYEKARKAAPGLDVHNAEHEFWAFWEAKGKQPFTKGADAAFIGFCRSKAKVLAT